MSNFKISLIVATYNWEKALTLCLKSILALTVLPDEVIIADDGSTVETKNTVEEFKKICPIPIHHVWHEDNGFRLAEIRNKAIIKAQFDYIIQIDGDVILHKKFIQDYKNIAKKNQFIRGSRTRLGNDLSQKLLNSKSINFSIFDKDIKSRTNGFRNRLIANLLIRAVDNPNKIIGCNMGYWREDALKINGYENSLVGWGHEDVEFASRLVNIGKKKVKIKYMAILFHIYHKEQPRNNEESHFKLIQFIRENKIITATNGINEILKQTL
ncbi:glycosyltransferase family 2 protein [Flavobacterium sp.]|jgi:glycosyltransferase involved in cell wall biosynthesis|uniref:glycosyltransferase family 2 protein n=1 Tax=Flavobacterium sp. TaxID=239 RepID=UPI0037BF2C94